MLFNSFEFIFLFLPVTVAGYFVTARLLGAVGARLWLIAASIFFYGWWNPAYLPLLGAVMLFTYLVGKWLSAHPSKLTLGFGIAGLLGVLGYYKYANFFVENVGHLVGIDRTIGTVVLPLAISFITFQKIAYLVDSYRGLTRDTRPVEFALFVVFFPQLIAGPIVHWRDVLPQFRLPETYRAHAENIAVGLAIFAIGLFKKAVLADGIAIHATPTFEAAETGFRPDFFAAWLAALAFSFQLYFDFSGYSDMAIGAARLFGIRLPLNFNSPYKALNVSEFWRRWHMTLSRFLRDYLYIPLGGNRRGEPRRLANLMATMLLGGLWHGASWSFVLWGGLHGLYLVVHHLWERIVPAPWQARRRYRCAAWGLTFIAVVVAWVPFKSSTIDGAQRMLAGMAGVHGVSLPSAVGVQLGAASAWLQQLGIVYVPGGGFAFFYGWIWVIVLLALAGLAPNTQQFMGNYRPALDFAGGRVSRHLAWAPTVGWGIAVALIAAAGVLALEQASEFLYYQF